MNDLFKEVDKMLDRMFYFYPVDTKPPTAIEYIDDKDGKRIRIQMALAGFSETDIKVWHEGQTLVVSGDNRVSEPIYDKPKKVADKFTMHFERKFGLAYDVDVSRAATSLYNGLLTIDMPIGHEKETKTYLFGATLH